MRVGIMQPYFFPYIGYWQLINAVDTFVILDDVNYIMRGYINRNEILLKGKRHRFTIPIEKASQNKLIMDTKINFSQQNKKDFLKTIQVAYSKAPYFDLVMPIINSIVEYNDFDLTGFIINSINHILKYLNIQTKIDISSKIDKNNELKAEARIIEICKCMHADTYINPSGGRKLYNSEIFKKEGIKLLFLDPYMDDIVYNQNQNDFVNYLSIIDVLMFNDKRKIKQLMGEYALNEK